MNRNLNIRKIIKPVVAAAAGCQSFFRIAPAAHGYPFTVWQFDELQHDGPIVQYNLMIDVVDYGTDDLRIETLCDAIEAALHRLVIVQNGLSLHFFADGRSAVEDSDKNIMHLRLTYELRVCEGG